MTCKGSKIHWHDIQQFGMPPKELRKTSSGLDRIFLVMTDSGLRASYSFDDGSGFADLEFGIAPLAWAYMTGE
ncbi:MAG: hypothetical protein RSD49_08025 [Hafnia sp.]